MSEDDEQERPTRLTRGDLAQAGDIPLDASGVSTWRERGRLRAHERLAAAQTAVARAKEKLNTAIAAYLESQQAVHEQFERNELWHANIDVVRRRIQDEYDAEDHQRAVRRLERQLELAEAEQRAAEAEAQLEATQARLDAEKQRRDEKKNGQHAPKRPSREDSFRQEAELIKEHGVSGRFLPIAEAIRQELIAARGGEEYLTEEDRERIERIFALARRYEESKG